jgi:acetyl esterase/lipase
VVHSSWAYLLAGCWRFADACTRSGVRDGALQDSDTPQLWHALLLALLCLTSLVFHTSGSGRWLLLDRAAAYGTVAANTLFMCAAASRGEYYSSVWPALGAVVGFVHYLLQERPGRSYTAHHTAWHLWTAWGSALVPSLPAAASAVASGGAVPSKGLALSLFPPWGGAATNTAIGVASGVVLSSLVMFATSDRYTRPRVLLHFLLRSLLRSLLGALFGAVELLLRYYVLGVSRLFFDYPITLLQHVWCLFPHAAQDRHEWLHGVRQSYIQYDGGTITVFEPDTADVPTAPTAKGFVVYVHGGGFACTNFFHYRQSVTFLVRAGFTVLGVDYPQAPTAAFPVPQLSILRSVRAACGHFPAMADGDGIHLLGDSAGGNLVLQAAMALSDTATWNAVVALETKKRGPTKKEPKLSSWAARPSVLGVCSIYGMMDREDSVEKAALPVALGLRFLWRAHVGGYAFPPSPPPPCASTSEYEDRRRVHEGGGLFQPAFADSLRHLLLRRDGDDNNDNNDNDADDTRLADDAFSFPRCLLCCGSNDFLLPSSHLVRARLQRLGCAVALRVYPGGHAFFGLPPGWTFGACFSNSVPCAEAVLDFMLGEDGGGETDHQPLRSGHMAVPRWEVMTFIVGGSIVILLPVILVAGPFVAWRAAAALLATTEWGGWVL